jgi:hypothetical protein
MKITKRRWRCQLAPTEWPIRAALTHGNYIGMNTASELVNHLGGSWLSQSQVPTPGVDCRRQTLTFMVTDWKPVVILITCRFDGSRTIVQRFRIRNDLILRTKTTQILLESRTSELVNKRMVRHVTSVDDVITPPIRYGTSCRSSSTVSNKHTLRIVQSSRTFVEYGDAFGTIASTADEQP